MNVRVSPPLLRLAGIAITVLLASACAPAATPSPTSGPAAKSSESAPAAPTPPPAGSKTAPAVAETSGQPRRGGVLRAATLGGAPKVLHPYPEAQHNTTPRTDAATLIYANLIDIDYETLDFVADPRRSLATELPKVSPDGRTFTFTLRDDIKWSDGRPITSADFQFAYQQASNPANNFVGLTDVQRIASYRTPDPKTIEVTLKDPLARFPALVIAAAIIPVPEHVWQGKSWLDPGENPEIVKPTVVSGPYMPKELTAEQHSYVRNPNWWGKQPNIDEIVFVNATPQTTLELLKTRQVEWTQTVPPAQYEEATKLDHVNAFSWVGATGSYRNVLFNLKRPYLADQRVRAALAHAINREDLVQFEDNLAVPQPGVFTDGSKWKTDQVEKYEFDLNRSKQLLTEAGYTLQNGVLMDASGQPLKVEIIWPTTSQPRGKMATYLQQQWKQLGVEATVTGLEFNAYVEKYQRQRDFDVAMGSYSATLDPDGGKSLLLSDGTQNATGYANPRVDELINLAVAEQDEAKRKQLYDELQKVVVADLPYYYMVSVMETTAFDKKVGGVKPLKGGNILRQNNLQVIDWYIRQ
jgi:peptide/nickel transport system substrate-binding protein